MYSAILLKRRTDVYQIAALANAAGTEKLMIALASDHGGFELKEAIKKHLIEKNYNITDLGTDSESSVDYPPFARRAAEAVASGECDCGIVCCGTGNGVAMTANKVSGIRCAIVTTPFTAEMAKRHNNANMIAMGGRVIKSDLAIELVDIWLTTEFEGGRHQKRIDMIETE